MSHSYGQEYVTKILPLLAGREKPQMDTIGDPNQLKRHTDRGIPRLAGQLETAPSGQTEDRIPDRSIEQEKRFRRISFPFEQ
jgi:hypothetical protein